MLFVTRLSTFAARARSLNVLRIARGVMFFVTPISRWHVSKAFFKEDSERRQPSSRGKRRSDGGQEVTERVKTPDPVTIDLPREVADVLRAHIA